MSFSASYDTTTRIVTALVFVAAIGGAVAAHSVPITFLLFLAICLSYVYSPQGYVCEGQSIIARRLVGNVTISLEGLREALAATKEDFRGCARLGQRRPVRILRFIPYHPAGQVHLVCDQPAQGRGRRHAIEDGAVQPG